MSRVLLAAVGHELRDGVRSGLVPMLGVLMVGYLLMVLTAADYVREMGGADVARNSAHLVHHMSSGQMFWLIFAWAWVFAQPVVRDRSVGMHELVLACPVPLRRLLLARFAGAYLVAILLGACGPYGFVLAPLLESLGAVPPGSMTATPWGVMTADFLLFIVPSALGLGAIYFTAALKTRSIAGPFAASVVIILIWMTAMVTLRGADTHIGLATLIDPTAYAEVEEQTFAWAPAEKASQLMQPTLPLVANRLLWGLGLIPLLAWALVTARREEARARAS